MLGKAMDFYIPGVKLSTLREIGMQMQIGGVGFYPTSGSPSCTWMSAAFVPGRA